MYRRDSTRMPCAGYPRCSKREAAPERLMSAETNAMSCPLYPRKRTCAVRLGMSALGHALSFLRWGDLFNVFNEDGAMRCGEPQSPHPRRRRRGATTCACGGSGHPENTDPG